MDKLVPHKYGEFKISQVNYYKQKLRKKIFLVVSALTLIISLYYLGKMFYYFDQFLD